MTGSDEERPILKARCRKHMHGPIRHTMESIRKAFADRAANILHIAQSVRNGQRQKIDIASES